jgi:hypothetical protein
MTKIQKIIKNNLIKKHCFNVAPDDAKLFVYLKMLLNKYKNVFLDNKRKSLHIINTKDKCFFKIENKNAQWNIKMISWPGNKPFLCVNENYNNFHSALNKMETINKPI